jgi:hypothetical protein
MGKPWFRVKRFGYGAGLPCSWEGWAVLAVFLAVVFGSVVLNAGHSVAHAAVILTATVVVILIAWRKSDGPWKWRNGE